MPPPLPKLRPEARGSGQSTAATEPASLPAEVNVSTVRGALEHVFASRPGRDEFAATAIGLITQSTSALAGALFSSDARQEKVHLVATVGLADDAVQVLSGETPRLAWDIPIRSLRKRRINVVEAAHENPFVPRPLTAISPTQLTIAALPFYHAGTPSGVVVLFASEPRAFSDSVLQALSQALRVCATALAELPAQAAPPAAAAAAPAAAAEAGKDQPVLLKNVAALKAELTRLSQALEESERQRTAEAAERITAESFLQAQRDRVAALEKELAAARDRTGQLPELQGDVDRLSSQLNRVRSEAESFQTETARLKGLLAEAEDRASRAEQRAEEEAASVEALTSMRDELQRRFLAAQTLAAERGEAVARAEARIRELSAAADQVNSLERAAASAEQARTSLDSEVARLRDELARTRAERDKADGALRVSEEALAGAQAGSRSLSAQLAEAAVKLEQVEVLRSALGNTRQQLDTLSGERAALRRELDGVRAAQAEETREREEQLQAAHSRLESVEAERDRLREELAESRARTDEIGAQLQAQLARMEAERRHLTGRVDALGQADSERARLQERLEEQEAELVAARTRERTVESRIQELGALNARLIDERRELHNRIDQLTKGGQTLEQEKQAAMNAALARVTELESALARMNKSAGEARSAAAQEMERLRADAEREADELRSAAATLRKAHEAAREELEHRQRELDERTQNLDQAGAVIRQLRGSVQELEEARKETAARLDAAAQESARMRQAREETDRRIAILEESLSDTTAARDALATQIREMQERLESTATKQLNAAEAARQEIEAELARTRGQHSSEVAALSEQLQQVRTALGEQLADMTRRHELVTEEANRLTRMLEEKDLLLSTVEMRLTASEPAEFEAAPEGALAIDRGEPEEREEEAPGAPAEEEVPAAAEAAEPDQVVILDDGEPAVSAARRLSEFGLRVSTVAPSDGFNGQLGGRAAACASMNLAAPSMWQLLRTARGAENGWPKMPMYAYTLPTGAATGFWFGSVDFWVLPIRDNVLTGLMQRLVPKIKRVIAMSSDLDVMTAVRTQLSASRISAAVVLDGRQALDLLPTIRPEAAILHLSPTCTDVFRAISGLRNSDIGRDIPILFLLDHAPQPKEEAFLANGLRLLSSRGNLKAEELVTSLAASFSPYRAEL